ncbi:MAG: SDR family oxidoreductase [Rhodoferax sp.]|nr:SDR family oxidoreductase [Rhodoferax sp.]MDP3651351.1 SDR family oxidoreductase [Rhodoferax sp.]
MRVLITGGFGFVGGRVAQHLQQAGHQIVLGTRQASCSPAWLPEAEVVTTNWHDAHALAQSCNRIDVVIHAAGMNAQDCSADSVAALDFNGLATARLVAAATKASVKRFIYLSTAHVYANPLIGTITEDTCPRNLHPYATSHLAGEYVVLNANLHDEIECIVLRLSNVFGTPAHENVKCWTLLLNDLCKQALQTRKLILKSSGIQRRDFIAMTEVCRVIEYFSSFDSYSLAHNVINVGSGVSQMVLEMAQLIQQRCVVLFGFEPELLRPPATVDERLEILQFKTDRLTKIGLNVIVNNISHVDDLLYYCSVNFDSKCDVNK